MQCSRASQQLQFYIDKQLTLEQMRVLESHIVTCKACQEDLFLFEEIDSAVHGLMPVFEPADLTMTIMQRVALDVQQKEQKYQKRAYELFRPSLSETLTAVLLATLAMLGIILEQPGLRAALPIANGHDMLSLVWISFWHTLASINSETLMLGFWLIGTVLGIWITLALAGAEMRNLWYRSVMDRLPVW